MIKIRKNDRQIFLIHTGGHGQNDNDLDERKEKERKKGMGKKRDGKKVYNAVILFSSVVMTAAGKGTNPIFFTIF